MYTRRASSYCSGDRRPGAGDADNNGGGANSMRLPFLLRKKIGDL